MSLIEAIGRDQTKLWRSFARALGAEPREGDVIRGASGLDHRMQAISVDEKGGRLILVSAEASPRFAALMQVDVQATMPDVNVLVARPVIFDIGVFTRRLFAPFKSNRIPVAQLLELAKARQGQSEEEKQEQLRLYLGEVFQPVARAWKNAALPTFNQLMDIVNQASYVDWKAIGEAVKEGTNEKELDLTPIFNIDNTEMDRRYGICAVPVFEFTEADWDLMLDERKSEELGDRLRQLNILQYFFPSPDQLALGLVDQGLSSESQVVRAVRKTPDLGHPLVAPELVQLGDVVDVIGALKDAGYVAEGEVGLEMSPAGSTVRTTMKFRPREGVVTKILNRISLKLSVSPKDFLPPH